MSQYPNREITLANALQNGKDLDELMRVALIKRANSSISVHRLVQKSFLQMNFDAKSDDLQSSFDVECKLLNYRFPKSDTGYSHMGK